MKKKNVLLKDLYMEFKKSWPRFLSILVMVLLGVAFFSGIRASGPDMKRSADAYYDRSNLMDIRVFGGLGLTDDDLDKIRQIEGVETAEPGYTADVLWNAKENQFAVKLMSATKELDQIRITEGRMPEKSGECLIDKAIFDSTGYQIGDKLEIQSGTDDKLSDIVKHKSFEIVGVGTSPYYLSLERGTTKIGTGDLKGFVVIPQDDFTMEAYTQIILSVENSKELLCYSDEYEDLVDKIIESIEDIADGQCELRYQSVKEEADEKITDGEDDIKDAKKKLADGQKKIKDAKKELADGRKEIEDNTKLLEKNEKKLKDSKKKIADGKKELAKGKKKLKKGEASLKKAKKQLDISKTQYKMGLKEYNNGKKQLEAAKKQIEVLESQLPPGYQDPVLEQTKKELQGKEAALQKVGKQLAAAKTQLAAGEKEYIKGKKDLQKNKKLLAKNEKKLLKGEKELKKGEKEIAKGKKKLSDARKDLAEGEEEFKDAWKEWKEKKKDAEEEIRDGEKDLADAKEELADLEVPEWYVLGRNSIQTYVEYGQDTERIEAIGEVFPAIFFLVAALVCLTTMTRMVQEDRTQIGVLKALGYTERQISMKYLVYALTSSLIGSLIGVVAGQKVLPVIIIKAYSIMYNNLPDILAPLYLNYSLASTLAALACVVLAAYSACHKTLKEVPANLMRPVAPKAGKRVFLERIPWLWKRLNFSRKAAVRNLVRYKKRLYMTVFGIGGCMGLLLVGFGLKDSITSIGTMQFGKVRLYDASVGMEDDATPEEREELFQKLLQDQRVKDQILVKESSVDVGINKKEKSAYLVVPKEPKRLTDFIALKERLSDKTYELEDNGIILTEKLASLLEVKKGDTVYLKEDETKRVEVKITGIVENYFYHYVFISPALYEKLYGEMPEYGNILIKNVKNDEAFENKMQEEYIELDMVSSVTFVSGTAQRVEDMLKSMDTVIYVLVLAAGLLAFVVLYNLNNINISERKRELATLKVLGFYDGEVSHYIIRENIVLTFLGILAGIVIGLALHRFVILTAEIDMMMFGRKINFISYCYSIGLTILFSLFVNGFMHFKMKKIDMIESLKSVE